MVAQTRKVALCRAVTSSDEPCYRVLVDGKQIGIVRRDDNVTATYWGAWRGGLVERDDRDDGEGIYCGGEPVRAESRRAAVADLLHRYDTRS